MEAAATEVRRDLPHARIVLVKIGTEIMHSEHGSLAMGTIGAIVEQIAALHREGRNVILISSGSVAIGKKVLHRQALLSGSMQSHLGGRMGKPTAYHEKACAAAGQSGLQSLYEMLFAQYHLACSQILATDADFTVPSVREYLRTTVDTLLGVGIIPIINENDVITRRQMPLVDERQKIAWDNDSLAVLFACEMEADAMVILTDVDGVYTATPDGKEKKLLHEFGPQDVPAVTTASRVGAIGQKEKLRSCIRAVDSGIVRAAIIAKAEPNCLHRILQGERVGTLFCLKPGAAIGSLEQETGHVQQLASKL